MKFHKPVTICFQLNVYAIDEGVPPKRTGPNVVIITVMRNRQRPVFQNEPYSKEIRQDASLGTDVLNVAATDADERVSWNYINTVNVIYYLRLFSASDLIVDFLCYSYAE
jgi:hypothetical protein